MNKKLNIISLILNVAIVILTLYSILYYFVYDYGTGNMGIASKYCLRYFTNLSNILAGLVSGIMVVFNVKNIKNKTFIFPQWLILLKYCSTLAVTVTMLTVLFFLGPTTAMAGGNYFTLFEGNCLYLHLITPLLAIISFVFVERTIRLNKLSALISLWPVFIYSIVYLILVVFVRVWPDFYGFTFNWTYWAIPVGMIIMYMLCYGLAFVIWKLREKLILRKMKNYN